MILSINYELSRPGQNYENLYKAIKDISGVWCHLMTSHWLVQTSLPPQQVWERLATHIDKNDNLLVIRVTNQPGYSGWLRQDVWDWMNSKTY